MNEKTERAIYNLSPAINGKCEEIKERHKQRRQTRLFAVSCFCVATVPALLVAAGISAAALITAASISTLLVVMLAPILIFGKAAN